MKKIINELYESCEKTEISKININVCSEEFYENLEYFEYSIPV